MLAELDLLLLILGEDELPDDCNPSKLTAGIDWNALISLAENHRVIPFLFEQCKNAPEGMIPPHILAELIARAQDTSAGNLALVGELLKLLDAFAAVGIGVIPFKGPLLAWEAYGSFALREPGDLDLLVSRDDIVRARNLLISMGLRPFFPTATPRETAYLESLTGPRSDRYVQTHCEHHLLRNDGELNVDLHWNVVPTTMAVALDPQMLWRQTRTVKLAGREILTLGREQLLLVLCLNGAKDGWGRLDRVCDVARLTLAHPDLDFDSARKLATEIGCTRILLLGLSLAKELLSVELPIEVIEAISRDCDMGPLVLMIRKSLIENQGQELEFASFGKTMLQLRLRERRRDRIRFALRQLSPTIGDQATVPLPAPLAFVHYFVRPLRLLLRHAITPKR